MRITNKALNDFNNLTQLYKLNEIYTVDKKLIFIGYLTGLHTRGTRSTPIVRQLTRELKRGLKPPISPTY